MVVISQTGNFSKTNTFLKQTSNVNYLSILEKYGREGVNALSLATPIESGLTSSCWDYKIITSKGVFTINWTNSNVINGVSIAIILQLGHATKNGGYVQGRDYINPAIKPIFDKIASDAWKEVSK